ncbi:MAG TPA: response regulator [Rhodopila sp.]|nr:response regulator [Rhodopila sp.]
MASNQPPQPRFASLSGSWSDAAEWGAWILGVAGVSALAAWLTDRVWIAFGLGIAGIVLAAWRSVKVVARLRAALVDAKRERAVMEEALRRSQKMEALGRLTVGVAHDFNNHLTVISSNVEMVTRRLDATEARLLRHTDAALQGVRRAAILTGRLLSFSRQPVVEPETVDVDRLVNGLSELLRRTLGDRIRLEVRLSGMPWFVWADVNQMENALLSLVVNARDQVPDGGELRIVVSNVVLDVVFVTANPTVVPGDYVQVAVSGSHHPTEAGRWEPADDLSSADLFMARSFVREAGGCLLRSDPAEHGLSLRLFLPRYTPPSVAQTLPPCATGRATTILVVEDEAAIRAVCVDTLRGLGYHVLEAPDAMEAFRLIADHGGIDLLFADLGLPGGVSGRALADAARNVDAGMRVLFTTGYERADLPDHVASALLRKPFNPAQLAAKVRDVLAAEQTVQRSETVQG